MSRAHIRSTVAALCITAVAASAASAAELTATDLSKLKRICNSLLDTQFLSTRWELLRPYLRDSKALDSVQVVCSGSCSGSIALREGLWFNFTFVNPQKMGKRWGPKDGLTYSITLSNGKRDILHRETTPKT
jgi:hypothetical protein